MQDFSVLFPYSFIFLFSFVGLILEYITVLYPSSMVGRNESDWSIFSGWFIGLSTSCQERPLLFF